MWWGATQDASASKPLPPTAAVDISVVSTASQGQSGGQEDVSQSSTAFEYLRDMRKLGELCDVVLVAPGEVESSIHGAVLAAVSPSFLRYLNWHANPGNDADPLDGTLTALPALATDSQQPLKLNVCGVKTSESVSLVIEYVYVSGTGGLWEYNPTSSDVNQDVLRLARRLELDRLHEIAARWLAKGLTTTNVVARLAICQELSLTQLRTKIIGELAGGPKALLQIAAGQEIKEHPCILQDLLIQVAMRSQRVSLPTPAAAYAADTATVSRPVSAASASNHMPTKRAKKAGA